MTTTATRPRTEANPPTERAGAGARGWYLYGITRSGPLAAVLAEADAGAELDAGGGPLELLELSGLAAVVRAVPLADFSPPVLGERLRDAAALEAMVRGHNAVTAVVHRRQAILPAKLGLVYADAGEVAAALAAVEHTLLRQLERVDGCDEWAVHLYADPALIRECIATGDPALRGLRAECASARPGRAFFLERELRDRLDAAAREALSALAQEAFDRLAACAVAGQANPVPGPAADPPGEVEILRAAFLVARDDAARFEAALAATADADAGLRCEQSGPWPPYSFTAGAEEEAGLTAEGGEEPHMRAEAGEEAL